LSANVGEGLFFAGQSHVAMKVISAPYEHAMITSNPQDIEKANLAKSNFEGHYDNAKIAEILKERTDYNAVENIVASKQQKTSQEKKPDAENEESKTAANQASGATAASAGMIIIAPVNIYSRIFNNPDRYSAEKLEKEANKYANKTTKTLGNKVTQRGNVYQSTFTNAQQEYYDIFAKNHRKAADRIFAKSPNGSLMIAIARDNARKANLANKPSVKNLLIGPRSPIRSEKIYNAAAQFTQRFTSKTIPLSRPFTQGASSVASPRIISSLSNRFLKARSGASPAPNIFNKIMRSVSVLRKAMPLTMIGIGSMLIFVVILTIIITFFFNVDTVVGNSNRSGDSPVCSGGTVAPVDTSNFDDYFTVTNATAAQKQSIYNMFAIPMASATYKKLLIKGGRKVNIVVQDNAHCVGAHVNDKDTMYMEGFFHCSAGSQEWFIIHESGHIIDARNSNLKFSIGDLRKADPTCYGSSGYIISYPWDSKGRAGTARDESFAEAIAQYVIHDSEVARTRDYIDGSVFISNYATKCSGTYAWAGNNIFDNINFSAGACTGSSGGGNASPNSNTCGTAYDFSGYPYTNSSFEHQSAPNFGDPECTMVGTAGLDHFLFGAKKNT
jgi:Na+-transporting methylmalonyl-CoA/oxaloacetate decarboxylase gamma subunit